MQSLVNHVKSLGLKPIKQTARQQLEEVLTGQ